MLPTRLPQANAIYLELERMGFAVWVSPRSCVLALLLSTEEGA